MQRVMKMAYEGIMLLLVMLTIMTIWSEDTINTTINWVVWAIFTIDFLLRLYLSEGKWAFIKENPFLVLAIIPLDQLFQVARIVRLIYFFRIKTITKYYVSPYIEKLSYKSLTMVLTLLVIVLIVESFIIMALESSVSTLLDAMNVTFGHLMFFGREIFVINHSISVWLLTATSIIGVIIQGLALQWGFHKADNVYRKYKEKINL
ncbi:transporter [Oceanobacillus senegalensis]|uniref:transporter n=1 Tax=Oceanobacillus senegalensis TaxID=1936063 RepID=UPI000A30AF20|nr:transporter [Oceanobacillus senegalensis]